MRPLDFWSPKLRNRHFESDVKLESAVTYFVQNFSPEEFHKMMTEKWKERMLVFIANGGGYFEKHIIVDHDDDNDDE